MSNFGNYAYFYDLLYKKKDYLSESKYISNLIRRYKPEAKNILNLGCGTGKHDFCLNDEGYSVTGVDMSPRMIEIANDQLAKHQSDNMAFIEGDIRDINLKKKFDVVISLFHVISYQTANSDLKKAFATAYNHLDKNGLFIFDCWYGPAVLTDKPVVRVKRVEDEEVFITRVAEPEILTNENVVNVNYEILVHHKKSDQYERITELHRMRYLFNPEIEAFLQSAGFNLIGFEEWMTSKVPGFSSWNVCFIARSM